MAKYRGTDMLYQRATSSAFATPATIPNIRDITPGFGGIRAGFDQSAFGEDWTDEGSGQRDGQEFTLTKQYDPVNAVHVLLKSDFDTPAPLTWIMASHVPSDTQFKITTNLRGFVINSDRTGSLLAEVTFKVVNPGVVMEPIP
jgi:hypothetical protein